MTERFSQNNDEFEGVDASFLAHVNELKAFQDLQRLAREELVIGNYPFVRPQAIKDPEELEWFRGQIASRLGVSVDQIHLRSLHEKEDLFVALEIRYSRHAAQMSGELENMMDENMLPYKPIVLQAIVEGQEPRFFRCDTVWHQGPVSQKKRFEGNLVAEVSVDQLPGLHMISDQHQGIGFFEQEADLIEPALLQDLHMDLARKIYGHEDFSPGDTCSLLRTPHESLIYRIQQKSGKTHWFRVNQWIEHEQFQRSAKSS